jgi:hypothetical protein
VLAKGAAIISTNLLNHGAGGLISLITAGFVVFVGFTSGCSLLTLGIIFGENAVEAKELICQVNYFDIAK